MTTIKLKNGSGAPTAGDLVQGEPALDLTNKRLYTEDSGGTVIEVGTNPTSITTGTFTSTGIDDNATSTKLTVADTAITTGSIDQLIVTHSTDGGGIRIDSTNSTNTGSIRFGDDLDNYIGALEYNHTNNSMSMYANNATRMTIDSSGNVGIGNTSPSSYNTSFNDLVVDGGTNSGATIVSGTTGDGTIAFADGTTGNEAYRGYIQYTHAGDDLKFGTSGSEAMRIDSSGNILFGATGTATTSYGAKVLKDSSSEIFAVHRQAADGDLITFARGGTDAGGISYSGGYLDVNGQVSGVTVSSGGAEAMRIDSSGNVGIGTTAVNRKLEISGNNNAGAKANYIRITDTDTTATAANQQGGIEFYANDATGGAGVTASMEVLYAGSGGGGEITFNTAANSGAGVTEKMRIDESGNVGIGTSSLGSGEGKLAVLGSNGTGGNGNTLLAKFGGNSAVQSRALQLTEYSISGINNVGFDFNAPGAGSQAAISFSTLSAERMRVTSAGNVGIGTTNAPYKLVVSNGGASSIEFGPAYSGTANLIQHYNRSGAAYVDVVNIAAQHRFNIGGSEQMRIDSSGRVGIGTASPAQTLHVSSTSAGSNGIRISNSECSYEARVDGGEFYLYDVDDARIPLLVNTSGNVGIGVTSPSGRVHADGDAYTAFIADGTSGGAFKFYKNGSQHAQIFSDGSGDIIFRNNTDSERMRIDSSGNVLVGKTSGNAVNTAGIEVDGNNNRIIATRDGNEALLLNRLTSDGAIVDIKRSGTTVGSISVTSSATAYNTSSDQRLKDNIVDAPSASDDIDAIQIRSFDWKADGSHQKYGMIAQELQTVAPDAVTEGDTEEDMMSVDYSKLVPMLVKEIQSLRARVAQLEGAN